MVDLEWEKKQFEKACLADEFCSWLPEIKTRVKFAWDKDRPYFYYYDDFEREMIKSSGGFDIAGFQSDIHYMDNFWKFWKARSQLDCSHRGLENERKEFENYLKTLHNFSNYETIKWENNWPMYINNKPTDAPIIRKYGLLDEWKGWLARAELGDRNECRE